MVEYDVSCWVVEEAYSSTTLYGTYSGDVECEAVKEFLYFYLHKPLFPTEIVKS